MNTRSEHECFQEICDIIENHLDHQKHSYEKSSNSYQKENTKSLEFYVKQEDFQDIFDFISSLEKSIKHKNNKKSKKYY